MRMFMTPIIFHRNLLCENIIHSIYFSYTLYFVSETMIVEQITVNKMTIKYEIKRFNGKYFSL